MTFIVAYSGLYYGPQWVRTGHLWTSPKPAISRRRSYYRSFKSPLEELTKGKRGRSRPAWWTFAPPHGERYRVTPLEGEKPALGVDKVAAISDSEAAEKAHAYLIGCGDFMPRRAPLYAAWPMGLAIPVRRA